MTKLSSHQFKTKEEAQAWIRKIMGPPKRRLEGKEHEQVWFMLQLAEPIRETNNQHSWTAEYNLNGKIYDVHFFPNEEPFIEEHI